MRLLLAHPKDWPQATIDAEVAALKKAYGTGHEIVPGRDAYRLHFAAAGGWDGWAEFCGAGRGSDGRASYDMILVPGNTVGRATCAIVLAAVRSGRRVFYKDDSGGWRPVMDVVPTNFGGKRGWAEFAWLMAVRQPRDLGRRMTDEEWAEIEKKEPPPF